MRAPASISGRTDHNFGVQVQSHIVRVGSPIEEASNGTSSKTVQQLSGIQGPGFGSGPSNGPTLDHVKDLNCTLQRSEIKHNCIAPVMVTVLGKGDLRSSVAGNVVFHETADGVTNEP